MPAGIDLSAKIGATRWIKTGAEPGNGSAPVLRGPAAVDRPVVSFEEAAEAFLDPFHQGGDASQQFEERQFLIGYSLAARLLVVI